LCGITGLFVIQRLTIYRNIKIIFHLIIIAILIQRAINLHENDFDLLRQLVNEIEILAKGCSTCLQVSFLIRDIFGVMLMFRVVKVLHSIIFSLQRFEGFKELFMSFAQIGFGYVKDFSFVKNIMKKEEDKLEQSFEKELKVKSRALGKLNAELPEVGLSKEEILTIMKDATKSEDPVWEEGNVSGAVYHGKRDHIALLNEAFNYYSISNPLHPDIWPSVMKFESEIIAMTAALVRGGNQEVCGCTTSVSYRLYVYNIYV
jgi:hypothetical protein